MLGGSWNWGQIPIGVYQQCIYPLALQFPISFKIIGFGIWLWLSKLVLCRFLQENHQLFEVFEITRTSGSLILFLFFSKEVKPVILSFWDVQRTSTSGSLKTRRTTPPNTGKNLRFSDTMRHVFKLGTIFQPFASCGQGLII